jgi:hypothetical protein
MSAHVVEGYHMHSLSLRAMMMSGVLIVSKREVVLMS